ncbi:uncharacterized protein NPIL_274191 [Nephila pilipes]|uniref:EGF-like domain-containing protein n=1 Tax=Nephila pilipes TaxID=299642 RepID=A0A8X6PMX9_NEPPI|nr:uncharacterized protein NPIL_274191 [Nephila pilipes]
MPTFVSLPSESMTFRWFLEKDPDVLPSNMQASSTGAVLTVSELRKEQEGVIACAVYTNLGVLATQRRFLIKEVNQDNNKLIFLATRPPYHVHIDVSSNLLRRETNKKNEPIELYSEMNIPLTNGQSNTVKKRDARRIFKDNKQYDEKIRKMKRSLMRSLVREKSPMERRIIARRRNKRSAQMDGIDYSYESSDDKHSLGAENNDLYDQPDNENRPRRNSNSDKYNSRRVQLPNYSDQYQSENRMYGNSQLNQQTNSDRFYQDIRQNEEQSGELENFDGSPLRSDRSSKKQPVSGFNNMAPGSGQLLQDTQQPVLQGNINSLPMINGPAQGPPQQLEPTALQQQGSGPIGFSQQSPGLIGPLQQGSEPIGLQQQSLGPIGSPQQGPGSIGQEQQVPLQYSAYSEMDQNELTGGSRIDKKLVAISLQKPKVEITETDLMSMLISECRRDSQCALNAACVKTVNKESGFCRCLPNYEGNGIFCWENYKLRN